MGVAGAASVQSSAPPRQARWGREPEVLYPDRPFGSAQGRLSCGWGRGPNAPANAKCLSHLSHLTPELIRAYVLSEKAEQKNVFLEYQISSFYGVVRVEGRCKAGQSLIRGNTRGGGPCGRPGAGPSTGEPAVPQHNPFSGPLRPAIDLQHIRGRLSSPSSGRCRSGLPGPASSPGQCGLAPAAGVRIPPCPSYRRVTELSLVGQGVLSCHSYPPLFRPLSSSPIARGFLCVAVRRVRARCAGGSPARRARCAARAAGPTRGGCAWPAGGPPRGRGSAPSTFPPSSGARGAAA